MSSSKPTFIPATFGHGSNSVSVQLLKFPPTDAPLLDKVQAFAYFDEVIQQFRSQLSSATLQQAYATTIPVSSSAAASEDSNRISQLLHAAFFSVNNLACLGFYTANRKSVRIDLDPRDRTASIRFVEFEATADPVVISPDLKSASPITVTYFLCFPQTIAPAAATPSTATALDVSLTDSNAVAPSIAMAQILSALASGTTVAELDLTDPSIATALSTLVMQASATNDDPLMATPRKLFTPPSASFVDTTTASPSIRRYLTTAHESTGPTYCGALDFLDSQSKFDAVFPPNDRKPISSLRRSNEPA
jgi:hypothetical protein